MNDLFIADTKVFWINNNQPDVKQSLSAGLEDLPKTEMAFLILPEEKEKAIVSQIFIVGYSNENHSFSQYKSKFLDGIGYSISIAIYEFDEDSEDELEGIGMELDEKSFIPAKPLVSTTSFLLPEQHRASPCLSLDDPAANLTLGIWGQNISDVNLLLREVNGENPDIFPHREANRYHDNGYGYGIVSGGSLNEGRHPSHANRDIAVQVLNTDRSDYSLGTLEEEDGDSSPTMNNNPSNKDNNQHPDLYDVSSEESFASYVSIDRSSNNNTSNNNGNGILHTVHTVNNVNGSPSSPIAYPPSINFTPTNDSGVTDKESSITPEGNGGSGGKPKNKVPPLAIPKLPLGNLKNYNSNSANNLVQLPTSSSNSNLPFVVYSTGPTPRTGITPRSARGPDGQSYTARSGRSELLSVSNRSVTPTWEPTSHFSFPVKDIPPKYFISDDLTLNDFTQLKHIGDGSNANILLGRYNNERIIIKMIKESQIHNSIAIHEFDLEHGMLCRLQHPNIIKILGAGRFPRRFIVLEYLSQGTLNSLLMKNQEQPGFTSKLFRKPSFTYHELLVRAKEIADAFDYLHRRSHIGACMIHRGKNGSLSLTFVFIVFLPFLFLRFKT
jgi:hypothetical protein